MIRGKFRRVVKTPVPVGLPHDAAAQTLGLPVSVEPRGYPVQMLHRRLLFGRCQVVAEQKIREPE
ncbi:hypothetical protein K0M31_018620, partial [Melipona bicolor]